MINLFFTGHKTPFKRYKSYFQTIDLIPDPDPDLGPGGLSPWYIDHIESADQKIGILTHSIGLVNALIYCSSTKIKPKIILAIDPPDISRLAIQNKLNDSKLPDDLRVIYEKFIKIIDAGDEFLDFPICLFRNIKNKDYTDTKIYSSLNYYPSDTHYPYMNRSDRDRILKLYEKYQ